MVDYCPDSRLQKQIDFIKEIDGLKTILRQSLHLNDDRRENDAEHAWTVSLMAVLLSEYASAPVNIQRVVKMLLIHDIVELDAGDLFAYDDDQAKAAQRKREYKAAERIFSILPEDQAKDLKALWTEFEQGKSDDALFANSMDRLSPLLLNYTTGGKMWKKHGVKKDRVLTRNKSIKKGSDKLWEYAEHLINGAVEKGYIGT
ncbi:MAG: HD domain-containing protein [Fibrobacteria bacterium]|nr:HD domain-containing protein [Fibrobacteria bacterium]